RLGREVALKVMREPDLPNNEAEVQRFRFGAQAAAELDHPNIAPIYQVGSVEGVPFVAMRLLEAGTLAQSRERLHTLPVSVVTLMAKIARAVHYAHERGVLHRDLKPANVVLDEHDEPYVVDFGFAKHLDERALTSKPSILVGTMGYMAPEQAAGGARSLTFAADIYALGAILYELLTGEVPNQGESLAELIDRPVRPPRQLAPNVDRELEWICLKCLEKDPTRRYPTALALAQDLECWLRCEPISIATESGVTRFLRWCRDHPALLTALSGALCVLAVTAAVGVSMAREHELTQRSRVLGTNTYAAEAKASHVLSQLRELSFPLSRCASDPRVAELVAHGTNPYAHADRLLVECGANNLFDSVAVVGADGEERARYPRRNKSMRQEQVVERDYFSGARRLGENDYRTVHVGRVLRSEDDGERRVSLSAPVFGTENEWLGVVAVTVDMQAFLESLRLPDDGRQMAVLAGLGEAEPGDPPEASKDGVMVLLHGRLGDAQDPAATRSWLKELRDKAGDAGRDPFRVSEPSYSLAENAKASPITVFGRRWLAGFAPVGHTGYAVVVQTRYDMVTEDTWHTLMQLVGVSGGIFVLGSLSVLALSWRLETRRRARRA
ncbi:MAG TPA: serine/threonine protein kinase, partial [Polyangiaceae bacterium]|nr:serine/threonine protein kinase [Polyangiaceae bacterium]